MTNNTLDPQDLHQADETLAGERPGADGGTDAHTPAADLNANAAAEGGCNIQIDPDFQTQLPPLSAEEVVQLESSLLREKRCLEELVVWKGTSLLLDGHNRLALCTKHHLPFTVREIELPDRAAAIAWMYENQRGRRNLTPAGLSYVRGRRYNSEKQSHGGGYNSKVSSGHGDHSKTEEILADAFTVAPKTIRRDGEFAEAVDRLASNCGEEVLRLILSREAQLPRSLVKRLAAQKPADQRKAIEELRCGGKLLVAKAKNKDQGVRLPSDPEGLARALLRSWDNEKWDAFRAALKRLQREATDGRAESAGREKTASSGRGQERRRGRDGGISGIW